MSTAKSVLLNSKIGIVKWKKIIKTLMIFDIKKIDFEIQILALFDNSPTTSIDFHLSM